MRAYLKIVLLGLTLSGCDDPAHGPFWESATKYRVIRESLYNQVVVERDGDIVHLKFRQGRNVPRQTAVDLADPERLVIPYSRTMLAAALVQPNPRRVLQLGLGGGALNRYLRRAYPEARITTVELDSTVRDMAKEFMGYLPDEKDQVVIQDARAFVKEDGGNWDWIFVDAFSGGSVPPHLKTREFYELLKQRLSPGGVVALNIHAGTKLYASDQATLRNVFPEVHLFAVPGTGNVIALALAAAAPDFSGAKSPAAGGTLRGHLTDALRNYSGAAASSAPVLSDDYAPAEFLQQQK